MRQLSVQSAGEEEEMERRATNIIPPLVDDNTLLNILFRLKQERSTFLSDSKLTLLYN